MRLADAWSKSPLMVAYRMTPGLNRVLYPFGVLPYVEDVDPDKPVRDAKPEELQADDWRPWGADENKYWTSTES